MSEGINKPLYLLSIGVSGVRLPVEGVLLLTEKIKMAEVSAVSNKRGLPAYV